MILAEKQLIEKKNEETSKEWYPGKYVGLPEPGRGTWYLGKRLGIRKKNSEELEPTLPNIEPLVWRNIKQLIDDLSRTQHIEGVNAVLEICCTLIDDNIELVIAAMNAIIRLGTGRLDRALRFGECGTCKYVVMLLHWFIYSDIDIQSPAKIEDREEFTHITETCVVSILGAIEVLAAGCKPNRERLGQMGACSYVLEAFRRHGKNGQNFYFTELVFNCIWQLSFGNIYNRSRLREAGAENILWRISNSPSATTAQRSRAQAVLGWLKSQLAEDLKSLMEPREVVGGLLLSISEISHSSAKGSPTEAIKLATESFLAIIRLCLCSNDDSLLVLIEEFTTAIEIPEKVIRVTRRILRHHKKIFKDDIEKLCNFIVTSCEVLCCLLSSSFRSEKNKKDAEMTKLQNVLPESTDNLPIQSNQQNESDSDEESDGFVNLSNSEPESPLVQLNRLKKEKLLSELTGKQMLEAGVCRMLVKELELYVDPSSSHYENTPAKHTHIALKSTSILDLDPLSIIQAGTGTLTRGVVAGLQGVKSGISLIGDAVQSTLSKGEMFPETAEGHCITSICQSIRILAEISLPIRINFLEENINTTCKLLNRGPYGVGIKNLQSWFLYQIQNDLMQKWDPPVPHSSTNNFLDEDSDDSDNDDINGGNNNNNSNIHQRNHNYEELEVDNGILTLNLALKVLEKFGKKENNPNLQMDDLMKTIFRDAIDYIGRFISERGMSGELSFAEKDGYKILFSPITKTLITDFKIIDAWITTITSIAMAKIDAKMILAQYGACEICLDTIRIHTLRTRIVEKGLWALCVLAANNATSMSRILNWRSDTRNCESAKILLTYIQKSKSQTNEAREHSALILSWMELRQNLTLKSNTNDSNNTGLVSTTTNLSNKSNNQEDNTSSISDSDHTTIRHGSSSSFLLSPRDSFIGNDEFSTITNSKDIFFSFSLQGHSKTGIIHEYGTTEI